MTKIYGIDDNDNFVDDEKPTWDDDIDITDIVPEDAESSKKKKKKKKKEERDDDGVDVDEMDADVIRPVDDEDWDGTEEMRKRKLDEYMDGLYELEFNDMVRAPPWILSSCPAHHLFHRLRACPLVSSTPKSTLSRSP